MKKGRFFFPAGKSAKKTYIFPNHAHKKDIFILKEALRRGEVCVFTAFVIAHNRKILYYPFISFHTNPFRYPEDPL